ncbi:tetraacyldisaccharide 4'-kinase [Granulicella arctica]|uniref:tetraacyldisaccharide 4'-kinase n=1 Tax=Granulicella arctica TaxID=940613 RepID=UPI0021DFB1F3|nr:tetraacyldisaccharide 4'-kinase [Granulicella arctica]
MKRPLLLPLVPVYGAGLWVARRFGGEAKRLRSPVVSVGSLSAGGAGKTPVVAALASLLKREGYAVDILSRGYGRGSQAVERVDPAGTAARFGDEPLLLAKQTSVPVYVGAERYEAGLLAEAAGGRAGIHLLDDGFQHRRLARDLDVVLLTAEDVADCLLPAGNLREPLSRLRRAGAVVVREDEAAALRPVVQRLAGAVPVWVIRRRLLLPAGTEQPKRLLAFCGIARPESFFAMLRAQGVSLAGAMAFRDHEPYRYRKIQGLLEEAARCGADGFVTTEKDAVKLLKLMRNRLEVRGPLVVAGLSVEFVDEGEVLQGVVAAEKLNAGSLRE